MYRRGASYPFGASMYTGFQDYRVFRSELRDSKDFRPDFMGYRILRILNIPMVFRHDFKGFKSAVREFSDVKSDFMNFGPHSRDLRSDLKGFRPFNGFHVGFYGFQGFYVGSQGFQAISEIFGRISRI